MIEHAERRVPPRDPNLRRQERHVVQFSGSGVEVGAHLEALPALDLARHAPATHRLTIVKAAHVVAAGDELRIGERTFRIVGEVPPPAPEARPGYAPPPPRPSAFATLLVEEVG
jgi:hypothetical protein